MECKLNKEKIRQGIIETAQALVNKTELFTITDNNVFAKNKLTEEVQPLTKEQQGKIESSTQYADDVKGIYHNLFLQDPGEFLRHIAHETNSHSASEAEGALAVAGERLTNLALEIFPNEGKITAEEDAIKRINKQFRDEVVIKSGPSQWTIHPSNELVMKYLSAQPASADMIVEEIRAQYLSQFSSTSLNLLADDVWLSHPILQDPTTQDLLNFAKKINPNFRVVVTDDLDVNAVSLIRDNIILIRQGSIISELPEEIAHFFVELLPDDHPLKVEMMEKIVDFPIYLDTFNKYKTNPAYQRHSHPDIQKIKREAVAKLIGEYIKSAYRNEADAKYGKKRGWLRDTIKAFFKFLRKAFNLNSSQVYTEPVFDINSPFREAGNMIQQGNITELNLKKVPSIYDSIFFSKIEDEMPEGYEASDIAKSLYEFSRTLKRQVTKVFFKYSKEENMKGFMELLQDPANKDYNRLWHVINQIHDAGMTLKESTSQMDELIALSTATASLAEAYREMEEIPKAINNVLRKMSKDKTEKQLLDNITELQMYFQFSDTFKKITDEFTNLLGYIRTTYPQQTENVGNIYDRMIEKMGSTEIQFKVVDEQIMRMLQEHIINLTHSWTDAAFSKYRGEINDLHESLDHHKLKNKVAKLITDKITSIDQIRQAVTGNFPAGKDLMLADGTKVNLSKIKDMSQIDYVVFLFSSPTLIADPFVSSVIAHFTDKYIASIVKGAREAKVFADKVTTIKKDLSDMGVGWYEAEEAIQNVQKFYDQSLEDKTAKKRTLLSATNRFDFQYENQVKLNEIYNLDKEISKLQGEFNLNATTPERKEELKTIIPPKQEEVRKKREEYDKWLNDWAHRPFTPEFYAKQQLLKDNKKDSPALRRMKELQREILNLEQQQIVAIADESTIENALYDTITETIAIKQNEKRLLQEQIPPTEKDILDILNDMYEVDEVATSRLRQTHKNKWVAGFTRAKTEQGVSKSKQEIEKEASDKYDALYTLTVPKQEFYDLRSKIFDQINAVTRPVAGLEKLSARLEELRDKEKKLLKPFRDLRGEINVTSFKYLSLEKDANGRPKLLSESLKELEEEVDMIVKKMRVYSVVLSAPEVKDTDKANILAYVDLSFAFNQIIAHSLDYKAEDVQEVFKDLIPLTKSQAEQILSATRKASTGDNSEFANLANLQLGKVEPAIKAAYSLLKFESPQSLLNAETEMYGAFSYMTRFQRSQLRESVDHLYNQLNALYSNSVSLQYYLALAEFFFYYEEYTKQDYFNLENKDVHSFKFEAIRGARPATVADIENMMADGVFEAVLGYMDWKEKSAVTPKEGYPLADLITFLESIHKHKVSYIDGQAVTTWTPISYVKKPEADPSLTEEKAPSFLTRNRIKDKYRTEKVYETNTEGKQANVDINGEWLPLEKEDSPFWNKEYAALKNAKDNVGKKQFELLQLLTQEYLQMQENYLPEGERLDLVIPSKNLDKLEQKKLFMTKVEDGWKYIRNATPFASGKTLQEEEQNYLEDISAVTVQNRDIYTGAIISEKTPKMRSRRRIPLARTSKDATSSIVMFIEDVNEYSAKTMVAPIMKSFADTFTYAHTQNPTSNRLRKGVLKDLYETKILGEVPKNFANNKNLSEFLAIVNRLTTFRLLGDPIGALVNLTSGTMQQLIEANFSASEYKMYMQSGWIAKDWLYQYDKDFYKGSNWGLQTQLIGVFNMIPDSMDLSQHLSKAALLANVRSKLMAPRSESEKFLAIHLGLSIVLDEEIMVEGKKLNIQDIYELDPVTNLVQVKNEYKQLEEDWNPIDGKKVVMLRRKLTQKYTLLQGNFFKQNQSFASTTAIGKTAEIMKRWFASGVIRRYQGEVIDQFTGETRKGYMLALANALGALIYGVRKGDMKYLNEYFTKITKRPSERKAMRRAYAEMLYTLVFGILALWVLGYDDDDEDKNKKLREMSYMKQLALLVTLRVQGELGTFIPVPLWGLGYMEMKRAILDPIGLPKASVDNIMAVGALTVMQILSIFGIDYDKALHYQKSKPYGYNFGGVGAIKDKGDSKLFATILNTVGYTGYTFEPAEYIKTLTQMQNRLK